MARGKAAFTVTLILGFALLVPPGGAAAQEIPTPEAFFGFKMGDDGRLADWPSIEKYFRAVAASSPRVELIEVGPSTEGRRIIAAVISSTENIRDLPALQLDNRLLADPRRLESDREVRAILSGAKAVVAIGCSIHASEVGATQSASELLYELAAASDERTAAMLRDIIVVLIPSLNPDGHAMVVDWQRKTAGTPFDGGPMPWPYHKYVGHDLNRDAFMLNMAESRALARFFSREWHPQVFLSMHQMGSNGPRFFVPPNADPIDSNQDPLIWREAALLGSAMAMELESQGKSGVVSNAMFDYFWPGYEDSAPLGRNTVCLLTEAASARLASPIEVAAKELRGGGRGLPEYAPQINFPNPWPGGTWRLRDIVDYNLAAMRGLLSAVARYRGEILANFHAMGRRAIARGAAEPPFAFAIPPDQHDPAAAAALVNLLADGGVEVHQASEAFAVGQTEYPAGTVFVLMAQPFRAYAKTLLEVQRYPVRKLPGGGAPERPYDVAGWTLPYQMGVRVDRIDRPFDAPLLSRVDRVRPPVAWPFGYTSADYFLVDARGTAGALAASRLLAAGLRVEWSSGPVTQDGYKYGPGTLVVRPVSAARAHVERLAREAGMRVFGARGRPPATLPLRLARTALYRPWNDAIDEGWTRWLLEQYEVPFATLRDAEARAGRLRASFDVIVLPGIAAERLVDGNRKGSVPDEYAGGLGAAGVAALKAFVQEGGTLVCLAGSGQLAIDALALPIKNVARGLSADRFFCPGSLIRLDVDASQPLGFGMLEKNAAFFSSDSAYEIAQGAPGVRVAARYAAKDLLLSGWLEGEQVLAGRPAVVEARAGAGRAVLIGFRAQHRGQSLATFRFLFNAIFMSP
ncbi:MAG TPA: M14 family metallopeptidase [Vicinamibacterales bacterium]|nr:M14 family metallopeptidase [Vicinamibacterales bacterium]HPW19224.1 M14 family metallopeptidase [Vicinamibacterales bacterium]